MKRAILLLSIVPAVTISVELCILIFEIDGISAFLLSLVTIVTAYTASLYPVIREKRRKQKIRVIITALKVVQTFNNAKRDHDETTELRRRAGLPPVPPPSGTYFIKQAADALLADMTPLFGKRVAAQHVENWKMSYAAFNQDMKKLTDPMEFTEEEKEIMQNSLTNRNRETK